MDTRNKENRLQANEISNLRLQDYGSDKNDGGNGNDENRWTSSDITLGLQEEKILYHMPKKPN